LVVTFLYVLVSLWLAIYSLHGLYLLLLYHRMKGPRPDPPAPNPWPSVTVQLPIYNEFTTVERLLAAVVSLDYPHDRLQIQVLDDSTDETVHLVDRLVVFWQAAGVNIIHVRRDHRQGYKAGALAHGTSSASGDFIAIFDADFVPPPDFLKRCLPHFFDPKVGCVQARWGHLNRDYSLLTRLQAMAIDAHFMVEQTARLNSGLLMNFNGSAGIWRKCCISDAGGWQSRTLTEDFDLSYRAQLRGWRIDYLPDLVVPAELPVQMAAFKQQQARWARGSLQTARKLFIPLIQSSLPLRLKFMGAIHLTHYLVHPLLLLALLLSLWMRFQVSEIFQWVPVLMITALISPLLYLTGAAPEAPSWPRRLLLIPALMLLSIGISYNNARAALLGLFGSDEGDFVRTPKFAVERRSDRWEFSRYAIARNSWGTVEVMLMILSMMGLLQALRNMDVYFIPWLLLYGCGYGFIVIISIEQSIRHPAVRP
jgi:cellulose synthase/poly-beta-1,6-N-acetylglucosamine synthase-like glycosyltransferase